MSPRQIVLDTETTGLETREGHRIIEIGCVEIRDRRLTGNNYHQYLQPDREIEQEAIDIHGITNESLTDKPRFADIVTEFIDYIHGAELIIHNAPFDVGFLNYELERVNPKHPKIGDICSVTDTLVMARKRHPGKKANLDALCNRYAINNSHRELHGALLDSEILADVYLAMTGGQITLSLDSHSTDQQESVTIRPVDEQLRPFKVIRATDSELQQHMDKLINIDKASGGQTIWNNPQTLSELH